MLFPTKRIDGGVEGRLVDRSEKLGIEAMNTTAEIAKESKKIADRESRAELSWDEARLLRTMATGGNRRAAANVGESEVMVGNQAFGANLSGSLERLASKDIGYVRDNQDRTYTLLDAGERAAFAPKFTGRTWLKIGLLAGLIAFAFVSVRHIYLFGMNEHTVRPPVGSIIAWHKNPAAAPDGSAPGTKLVLPEGWMECNGDQLPLDSPLRNTGAERVPDLNNKAPKNHFGRFLRGNSDSGIQGVASSVANPLTETPHGVRGSTYVRDGDGDLNFQAIVDYSTRAGGSENPITREPSEMEVPYQAVRPVFTTVVWIIRVK